MTPNQLIVLLNLHRGSEPGAVEYEIEKLNASGFVSICALKIPRLTSKGRAYVEAATSIQLMQEWKVKK